MTTFVRNSQFLAAFSAASCEYAAAVSGGHTFTETVLVAAFALRWLKCSFHFSDSLGPSRGMLLTRNNCFLSQRHASSLTFRAAKVLLFFEPTKFFGKLFHFLARKRVFFSIFGDINGAIVV